MMKELLFDLVTATLLWANIGPRGHYFAQSKQEHPWKISSLFEIVRTEHIGRIGHDFGKIS